jgi:hypothetical protein
LVHRQIFAQSRVVALAANHTGRDDPPILTGHDNQKENTGEAWLGGRHRRRGDCHRRSVRLFIGQENRKLQLVGVEHCIQNRVG